jgi:hypothetical protein
MQFTWCGDSEGFTAYASASEHHLTSNHQCFQRRLTSLTVLASQRRLWILIMSCRRQTSRCAPGLTDPICFH